MTKRPSARLTKVGHSPTGKNQYGFRRTNFIRGRRYETTIKGFEENEYC